MARFNPTPADTLALAGALLYGAHWRAGLAQAMGVEPARLRRLVDGREPINPSLQFMVRVAIAKRRAELQALERRL
jgi:hypothetical protein